MTNDERNLKPQVDRLFERLMALSSFVIRHSYHEHGRTNLCCCESPPDQGTLPRPRLALRCGGAGLFEPQRHLGSRKHRAPRPWAVEATVRLADERLLFQ